MKPSLERTGVAFVALSLFALPVIHGLAYLCTRFWPGIQEPGAVALSLGAIAIAALAALTHGIVGRRTATLAVGSLAGLAIAGLAPGLAGAGGALMALVLAGPLLSELLPAIARRLPAGLDGQAVRRPLLAGLLVLMGLASVAQTGRMAAFMSDRSLSWGPVLPEYFEQHTCLAAYLYAAELNGRGEENIYDTAHYPGLDTSAAPVTAVEGMQPYLEDPYQYPPPFLLLPSLVLKLTGDYQAIQMGWFVLQSLLFLTTAWVLARWIGGRHGLAAGLLAPLVWASIPTMFGLQYGQFHLAALCLSILGMLALQRGRAASGGALLATAILAKLFPLVLLIPLAVQRRWRALGWTAAYGALFTVAGLIFLGTASYEAFFSYHLPRLVSGEAFAFHEAWPEMSALLAAGNQSPLGLVQKLGELGIDLPASAATILNALFSALLIAVGVYAGLKVRTPRGQARVWLALLSLAAMRSGGAWAEYINVAGLWMLSLSALDLWATVRGRILLLVGAGYFLFLPGIVPLPALPSTPVMMVLSLAGFAVALWVGLWGVRSSAAVPALAPVRPEPRPADQDTASFALLPD